MENEVLLQLAGGPQVSQELDNVLGHRRSDGQVVTLSLETVLVSNPVDGDGQTFGGGVGVGSARYGANVLRLGSDKFLVASSVH